MTVDTLMSSEYETWAKIWRQYLEFYETSLPESQYKNTWSRIQDPSGDLYAFVARDDTGKIVGLAHYLWTIDSWSDKPQCYLNDLFVDPTVRGKGHGRELIQATAAAAEKHGCMRLQWTTKHDNYVAQRLYDGLAVSDFKQYIMNLPQK